MGMRDFHFKVKVSLFYFIFLIPLLHDHEGSFEINKKKDIYGHVSCAL